MRFWKRRKPEPVVFDDPVWTPPGVGGHSTTLLTHFCDVCGEVARADSRRCATHAGYVFTSNLDKETRA